MEKRNISQAGYSVPQWCEEVGISRPTYYNLPPELQPFSVKILKRRIINESPSKYLQRIRSLQQAA